MKSPRTFSLRRKASSYSVVIWLYGTSPTENTLVPLVWLLYVIVAAAHPNCGCGGGTLEHLITSVKYSISHKLCTQFSVALSCWCCGWIISLLCQGFRLSIFHIFHSLKILEYASMACQFLKCHPSHYPILIPTPTPPPWSAKVTGMVINYQLTFPLLSCESVHPLLK